VAQREDGIVVWSWINKIAVSKRYNVLYKEEGALIKKIEKKASYDTESLRSKRRWYDSYFS